MHLFSRLRRHKRAMPSVEVTAIQDRVRSLREQIGQRDIELAVLFALVEEDESPLLREISEVKRPKIERFWPEQVPTLQPLASDSEQPKVSYTWQAPPRSTLPTSL